MIPFEERAEEMGLDISGADKGLYQYTDNYSRVVYRVLQCGLPSIDASRINDITENLNHPTDGLKTPLLGIWTAPSLPESEYKYIGYVSQMYKFVGNQVVVDRVINSLQEIGNPIIQTNVILKDNLSELRQEVVLRSSLNSPHAGDINPVIIIQNSYNGTRCASVSFGISLGNGETDKVIFAFNLGEMKMIHIESSSTSLSSGLNQYLEVFNNNILELIDISFNTQLTQEQLFGTLEVIEKYGKRKREQISSILDSLQPAAVEGQSPPLPSAWNMFLAVVRYSALEPSLNIKRLLESIAESVLVVPQRMIEVLKTLQDS